MMITTEKRSAILPAGIDQIATDIYWGGGSGYISFDATGSNYALGVSFTFTEPPEPHAHDVAYPSVLIPVHPMPNDEPLTAAYRRGFAFVLPKGFLRVKLSNLSEVSSTSTTIYLHENPVSCMGCGRR